jgi:hypothetical protein
MAAESVQTYKNISEEWGDAVGGGTPGDYIKLAVEYGVDPDKITFDSEHIYYDRKIIADAE